MKKAIVAQKSHKERILSAATDVFLEFGFEQTSTAEIARRAKVSKRELYFYFSDKRALLGAVITELQEGMQSRMDALWSSNEDMGDVLRKSGTAIREFVLSERFGKLLRIVASEAYHNPKVAEQFYELGPQKGRKATAQYMKAQMAQGRLRKENPLRAADDFLGLIVGAQLVTAQVLGQIGDFANKRSHIDHSVSAFLEIYGCERVSGKMPKARPQPTR